MFCAPSRATRCSKRSNTVESTQQAFHHDPPRSQILLGASFVLCLSMAWYDYRPTFRIARACAHGLTVCPGMLLGMLLYWIIDANSVVYRSEDPGQHIAYISGSAPPVLLANLN